MSTDILAVTNCRACGCRLNQVMNLGETTLANDYQTDPNAQPFKAPLALSLCIGCSLLQLSHTINPERLFTNYKYCSGQSGSLTNHFRNYAKEVDSSLNLKNGSFIVGIGGNDGVLEREFITMGYRVLNIEPSKTVAEISIQSVPTHCAWFNQTTAEAVEAIHGHADVITCNNCFAHMPDIREVMGGIKLLLRPGGVLIIESSYLGSLISKPGLWDQIYHEHVFYWSCGSLRNLFNEFGMSITHWETNEQQGGSFRCYVVNDPGLDCSKNQINYERKFMLHTEQVYTVLLNKIRMWQMHGLGFVQAIQGAGKTLSCYGAAAKLNMISYLLSLRHYARYIIDDSPMKQFTYAPDSMLPIKPSKKLEDDPTDFCLITSANYADLIRSKNAGYKGKWLLPYPNLYTC